MENNKEYWEQRKKYDYHRLNFNVYKIEVGVLLEKDDEEYDCYNQVYDKKHGYYDENVSFELDYLQALNYAKQYVENGVNGTYAIISKLTYNSEEIYGGDTDEEIDLVARDLIDILGGGHIDNDYVDMFGGEELYHNLDNIIYSICKQKDKDHPYYLGKGDGNLIENFIQTKEEQIVEFMFDNNYINASEYDHWFEEDIICIDQKIVLLYLTLEEMGKLHLDTDTKDKMQKEIEKILVKYENV